MELFHKAKAVRLQSHHEKYLTAEEDEESVTQDRNGASKNAKWVVEFVEKTENVIRLKSCYGKYLTASNQPFLLGMTGRKVLQTLPNRLDSSIEWEPIREGHQVKLRTRYGQFLRGNGGLPPWRNSVTHDIPHRTKTQDWVLWDVHVVEILAHSAPETAATTAVVGGNSDSFASESSSPTTMTTGSSKSHSFSRQEVLLYFSIFKFNDSLIFCKKFEFLPYGVCGGGVILILQFSIFWNHFSVSCWLKFDLLVTILILPSIYIGTIFRWEL